MKIIHHNLRKRMDQQYVSLNFMKTHKMFILLTSNWFIIGLIILLYNDFYLKYAAPSILTGKLSDFAGLFIFPFLISVIIPRPRIIYLLTALFFCFWKLEFSQSIIDYISYLTDLGFYRTVDPTDLIALTILPISYQYLLIRKINKYKNQFILSSLIALISIFSFCATTLPRRTFNADLKVNQDFVIPLSKDTLFKKLNFGYSYSDTLSKNLKDTLFYLYFKIPDYLAEATVIAKIKYMGTDTTIIELDRITKYSVTGRLLSGIKQSNIDSCEKLTATDFEKIFEANYIDILLNKKKSEHGLYFDNKELIDNHLERNKLH